MNVLIYFLDEQRADVLGCYGHPFVRTPAMDMIAASGMRFDAAYSNCPLCMPARMSFFTGRYPSEHGVLFNGNVQEVQHGYDGDPALLAFGAMLRDAGFDRIVNVGKHHTGFSPEISGFTEHIPAPDGRGAKPPKAPEGAAPDAHVVKIPGIPPNTILGGTYPGDGSDSHPAVAADRAIEALGELAGSDRPWLLRVSINAPHTPVMPPAPYDKMYESENAFWEPDSAEVERRTPMLGRMNALRGFSDISLEDQRWARTCYHGLTSFVDAQIGRIEEEVARLGLAEDLLTIVISDHGSSIGDHGQQVKGPFDTDDIARIPLIVRGPGVLTGTYGPMVQMIDVLPTLASLVGRGRWKEEADATVAGDDLGVSVDSKPAPAAAASQTATPGAASAPSRRRGAAHAAGGNSRPDVVMGGALRGDSGLYSGRSLADVLAGHAEPTHDAVFSEGEFPLIHPGQRRSVRTERWLYTRYPEIYEQELFDLVADPKQTANVAGENSAVVAELGERIEAWRRVRGARVPISFGAREG